MNTAARLSAFGATVVLVGTGAFAAGATLDVPTDHLRPTAESSGPGGDHGTGPGGSVPGHPVTEGGHR